MIFDRCLEKERKNREQKSDLPAVALTKKAKAEADNAAGEIF